MKIRLHPCRVWPCPGFAIGGSAGRATFVRAEPLRLEIFRGLFRVTEQSLARQLENAGSAAQQVMWLAEHRLIAVADLLVERGLMSESMARLARAVDSHWSAVSDGQLAEERRVLEAFAASQVPALALKGALLAYSVYPDPRQRWRADLDVLVAPDQLTCARDTLAGLQYRPIHSTPGGTPIRQETWVHDDGTRRRYVDMHWDLRDHPLLRDCFSFEEQHRDSVELPGLAPGARGQGSAHALLNSAMHWYDDLYEHQQPLGWLLDNDLLWRHMDERERGGAVELAIERGVAGLLADVLERTRDVFETPVPDDVLNKLARAGQSEPATRLIEAASSRYRSFWLALRSEPGWRARISRVRHSLFPPAAHMRERYPDGSRLGLPGLYLQRILKRVR